jgi:hypothetical protein
MDQFDDIPFTIPLSLSMLAWMLSFSVLLYIRSKIARAVSYSSNRLSGPISQILASRPLRVPLSAGLGAAFGYLFLHSINRFYNHREDVINELIGIAIVSVSVLAFLEPIVERIRSNIGLSEAHSPEHTSRPLAIKLAAVFILAFVSLSHGLLHSFIEHHTAQAVAVLLRGLMIAGGVTVAWRYGARCRPSCASQLGVTTAALLWCGRLILLWTSGLSGPIDQGATITAPAEKMAEPFWGSVIHFVMHAGTITFPAALQLTSSSLQEGEVTILVNSLPWVLAALVGGWFVTPRWPSHPYLGIVAALLAAVFLVDWLRFLLEASFTGTLLRDDLAIALGWALGLIIMGPTATATLRDFETMTITSSGLASVATTRPNDSREQTADEPALSVVEPALSN